MAKKKLIITCALSGAGTPKSKCADLPTQPDEIVADAVRVVKAGAAIVHIHARDKQDQGTVSSIVYDEIYEKLRKAMKAEGLNPIINLTTSGGIGTDEERVTNIRNHKPEMCSFDSGSFNWADWFVYDNPPSFLRLCAKVCLEHDIKPEVEVFDSGHIVSMETYIREGLIKLPVHYQFVLGVGGAMKGTVKNMQFLHSMLPEGSTWSATGIGVYHMPVMLAALALGADGIRVGLEDNIYITEGVKTTNTALVERAVRLGEIADREIATPDEAREMLGITRTTSF